MRFDTLDEWLQWQEGLHYRAIDLGLDRCREVAARMGLLQPGFRVISVAGTNGKGSSVAMLDRIYRDAGYDVGMYTSPHLVRYNERISINGREAEDLELCSAFERVDQARGDVSLTYFEFGTLAAIWMFHQAQIEIAVLEVGLGGRLDAVNILDADVALICTIGLEHTQWLGHTRELIGREKAGIMRHRRPAVCSDGDVPDSIITCAAETGARLYLLGRDFRINGNNTHWDWHSEIMSVTGLSRSGQYNNALINNTAGVLMTVALLMDKLPVNITALPASLSQVVVPGRFQVHAGAVPVILDVAHNPQAAGALVRTLAEHACAGATHMVIGMLDDKDHRGVIEALSVAADHWYVVSLNQPRGTDGQVLVSILEQTGNAGIAGIYTTVEAALDAARGRAVTGDRVVVTGSFLTVGAAMQKLATED
jgi:dihydrofolate synthase/folylpolyglutamate synthase